jgi:hypothetical protein
VTERQRGRERATGALEKEPADDVVIIPVKVRSKIRFLETESDVGVKRGATELSAIVTMDAVREAKGWVEEGRSG